MRISQLTPLNRTLEDGNLVVANFEAELAEGVTAKLTLVRSGRDGTDLIWSRQTAGGPIVRFSRDARVRIALAVRAELRAFSAALAAA